MATKQSDLPSYTPTPTTAKSTDNTAVKSTSTTYNITKTGLSNLKLTLDSPLSPYPPNLLLETALYSPGKPDVALYALSSKGATKSLLGSVDLGRFSGRYTVIMGTTADDGKSVLLERVRGWTSRHTFSYPVVVCGHAHGNGAHNGKSNGLSMKATEERRFVWRHPGEKLADHPGDLELVEEELDSEDEREEEEYDEDEEMRRWEARKREEVVLASYFAEGGSGKGRRDKGRLVVQDGDNGDEWVYLVSLTALALIVLKRREQ